MCTVAEKLQRSPLTEASFGGLLFELRRMRCVSQRELAKLAHLSPSVVSEIENTRRAPPPLDKVIAIGRALRLAPIEQSRLIQFAELERTRLGLRIKKSTPIHVADLLREIASLAGQLSPAQVQMIKQNLAEAIMK